MFHAQHLNSVGLHHRTRFLIVIIKIWIVKILLKILIICIFRLHHQPLCFSLAILVAFIAAITIGFTVNEIFCLFFRLDNFLTFPDILGPRAPNDDITKIVKFTLTFVPLISFLLSLFRDGIPSSNLSSIILPYFSLASVSTFSKVATSSSSSPFLHDPYGTSFQLFPLIIYFHPLSIPTCLVW